MIHYLKLNVRWHLKGHQCGKTWSSSACCSWLRWKYLQSISLPEYILMVFTVNEIFNAVMLQLHFIPSLWNYLSLPGAPGLPHPIPLPYLKPLSVWLHFQHHAWIWFWEGVAVRDPPAGDSQLHFGQAWRADEAQRGFCRLIDVTHAEHKSHTERRKMGKK